MDDFDNGFKRCSCRTHDFGCMEVAMPITGRVIPGGPNIGPALNQEWPEIIYEDVLDADEIE